MGIVISIFYKDIFEFCMFCGTFPKKRSCKFGLDFINTYYVQIDALTFFVRINSF